jgi:hypothetical protein
LSARRIRLEPAAWLGALRLAHRAAPSAGTLGSPFSTVALRRSASRWCRVPGIPPRPGQDGVTSKPVGPCLVAVIDNCRFTRCPYVVSDGG